jgi:hypothetical protein
VTHRIWQWCPFTNAIFCDLNCRHLANANKFDTYGASTLCLVFSSPLCDAFELLEEAMSPNQNDPVIDEIRESRHQISQRFDHDPSKPAYYIELRTIPPPSCETGEHYCCRGRCTTNGNSLNCPAHKAWCLVDTTNLESSTKPSHAHNRSAPREAGPKPLMSNPDLP